MLQHDRGKVDVISWLNAFEPGVRDLEIGELRSLMQFTLLWSFFEAKVCANRPCVPYFRRKIEEWAKRGIVDPAEFQPYLEFFQNRYIADGEPTYRFDKLHMRKNDDPDRVIAVLKGQEEDVVDVVTAVLTIVYRYRNNLFNGLKWVYNLHGQGENFSIANEVLARALETYRRDRQSTA